MMRGERLNRRMSRSRLALTAAAVMLALTAAGCGGGRGPLPRLLGNGGPHGAFLWQVRPGWILYTGDGPAGSAASTGRDSFTPAI
jgi:hypothetical protein